MSGPLLQLKGVDKNFGGIRALSDVSCDIRETQIAGIIGPNGAGKTTLFNIITGAYATDGGDVTLGGHRLTGLRPSRIARAGIARTFQNIRLFGSMSVWEHLLVAQPHHGSAMRRLLPARFAGAEVVRRADETLEFFGLRAFRDVAAHTLPYGLQRKVEMARAVAARPKLLLLDEPIAGMNHDEAEDVRASILALRDGGLTVLVIEHDMNFVMRLCDDLTVLDFGRVIARGHPAEVRANPAVLDAYLGHER